MQTPQNAPDRVRVIDLNKILINAGFTIFLAVKGFQKEPPVIAEYAGFDEQYAI